jgi:hypothetical protein
MARQIGGTGGVDHAQQAQWAGNQRLVPYGPKPQYTVEPLLNQIDLPIRTRHLQLQLGVSRHEIRQGRHDRRARHLGRKIDPQPSAKRHAIACEHRMQVIDFSKQIAGTRMKCASVLGQLHAAGRPVQKPGTDIFFQLPDRR